MVARINGYISFFFLYYRTSIALFLPTYSNKWWTQGLWKTLLQGKKIICFFLHSTIWNQPIMQKEIGHGTRKTIYVKCIQGKKMKTPFWFFFFLVNWFDFETVLYEGDVCVSVSHPLTIFAAAGKDHIRREKQALGLGWPSISEPNGSSNANSLLGQPK